jgi:hypothetical protein
MIKINNNTLLLVGLILCCIGCSVKIDIMLCFLFCILASNFVVFNFEINDLLCCILMLVICCGTRFYVSNDKLNIDFKSSDKNSKVLVNE